MIPVDNKRMSISMRCMKVNWVNNERVEMIFYEINFNTFEFF